MKKIILLSILICIVWMGNSQASCLEVSDVERPGPNLQIFLDALVPLVQDRCNHDVSTDLVELEFDSKKKGKFEITISHVPVDCITFGMREAPKCDVYDTARCYSIGMFTLIPNPEEAKTLAKKVAEKINSGNWMEKLCPEGDPD